MSLVIENARVIDPIQNLDAQRNIFIVNGKIVALGDQPPEGFVAKRTIDAKGLIACPGLMDLAARLREPGFEHLNTGGWARHNAAQECQRGPILDPFMAASFMVRSDQLAGKFDDLFKKGRIFLPQLVEPFKGLAFGERGFLSRRPFGHICSFALHKESRQLPTLRLIGIGQVEKFEILAQ